MLFAALAAIVACAWFLTLDARHLLPADEGRYAEIAREMLASGDWVTIRYNGVKYFEKPPFQIWMTALAFKAFGIGEWQARLWTALCGAAGLIVTATAAARWYGRRVGMLTGLVLLAAPAWNIGGHFNSLDMGLSAALAFVLAGFLIAQHPAASGITRRNWMLVAWAAMGIAILTKGLIGLVLPGLILVVYSVAARDGSVWRRLHLGVGLLVMLAIATPWFVLVSRRNPEFLDFFFIHEHLQRYLSPIHHREGSWWYFLPQLVLGFLPWLGLSWSMAKGVRSEPAHEGFRPALLLGVWAASILVFFSFSSSKLPGYVLPLYPALAILAACALDRLDRRQWRRHVLAALLLMVIGCIATPFVARQGTIGTPNALYREFALWLAAALALGLVG
ncbi:MAG TPA: glycosyltransferase family 39 protein, partial [Caldimonas sp.]